MAFERLERSAWKHACCVLMGAEICKSLSLPGFLKHIHQRDMLKLWGEFLDEFKEVVLIDKANGYIYLKQFIWYTDAKVPEERKQLLEQLIKDNLSKEDTDNIMRTIADSYIEEGFNKGLVQGIEKGREEGREEGIQAGMEKAASNMLNGFKIHFFCYRIAY